MRIQDVLQRIGLLQPRIFISYRRSDGGGYAGQLLSALRKRYGGRSIFLDHEDIAGGEEFGSVLEDALRTADVVLVVIGPEWLERDADGRRRIDDRADWVRREVASSLQRDDVRVVPVLVGGAELPAASELPPDVQPIVDRQARPIRPDRFKDDALNLARTVGGSRTRWYRAAVAAAVLVGAALTLLPERFPPQMTGDFNVAVAEFTEIVDGADQVSESSSALAASVSRRIADDLQERNETEGFDFQVRHPPATGAVLGATPQARAESAAELATSIGADVIVYGTFADGSFSPSFLVTERGDRLRGAEELAGDYQLGSSLLASPLDVGTLTANAALRQDLTARTAALIEFIVGLSWYQDGAYGEAAAAFGAADIPDWSDEDGKEIVHLFLGNALGNLGLLDDADAAYAESLRFNDEYARAIVGQATVSYLQASGDCDPASIDRAGLDEALTGYERALAADDQPLVSNISAKTAFGRGRVFVCLSQAGVADFWSQAGIEFSSVVEHFDGGASGIRDLAVESHAALALVALPFEGDPDPGDEFCESLNHYREAIALGADEEQRARYEPTMSFVQQRLDELGVPCPEPS